MDGPPPPPPPHGEKPNTTHGEYRKTSDLPEGNYDIFIIPPHSSGSGFLYLPSLQCHRNSFIAGSVSTLFVVLLWSMLSPILKVYTAAAGGGGAGSIGIALLGVGVGVAGLAFGASQAGSGGTSRNGGGRFGGGGSGAGGAGSQGQSAGAGTNQSKGAESGGQNSQQQHGHGRNSGGSQGSQYTGNQHGTGAPPNGSNGDQKKENGNADWDRAREETRRKEGLRQKMEEFKRKRDAEAREKQKQREHEAMDRELRERKEKFEKEMAAAREAAAREARQRAEREAAEARSKAEREAAETRARAEKEAAEATAKAKKEAAEMKEREEKAAAKAKAEREAAEKEAAAKAAAKKEADAKFAALKEAAAKKYAEKKAKDALEAAAKEAASRKETASNASAPPPRSPSPKKPPSTGAKSTTTGQEDPSSFKPYERVRRPYGGATSGSSAQSESSYTPSQSTSRTSPPPSNRGGYSTKDPDKIVISGVFPFNDNFIETPVAQLVSGQGMVTDGLVLRITTEGMFIDDDIRGIPQREWDTKAWTMKMVEVWCSQYAATPQARQTHSKSSNPFRRSAAPGPTPEESDAFLMNLLKACKNTCRLGSPGCFSQNGSNIDNSLNSGLHVLRASFRDQDGKKYVFVLNETEGWKVAIGLQRLRRGTQVRALGVASMAVNDRRMLLENLGYA